MSKHTPGPWKWRSGPRMGGFHVYMDTAIRKRSGYESHHHLEMDFSIFPEDGEQWEEAKANTRLIAAAPELLAIVTRELRNGEQSHFEDWLERTCPSGDVESVERQWAGSADYAVFADEYREELAVLDKIEGRS